MMGEARLGEKSNRCPFIENGTMSIGWQGNVSPCLSLLHDDVSFLDDRPRRALRYSAGNVSERSMHDIWMDPAYIAFRRRVQEFEFSPCTYCGGCDLSESNREDCFGNEFPTCGGCLWAQGVIQCP
jgi:MoaA/NifB/PqqE/SkfB family radical SAM enzyme